MKVWENAIQELDRGHMSFLGLVSDGLLDWSCECRFVLKYLIKNLFDFFCAVFVFRMPVLYERLGIPGRILSSLFFLCLSLGGVSSLVAMIELPVHTLEEMRGALVCVIRELKQRRRRRRGRRLVKNEFIIYKRNSRLFRSLPQWL